MITIGDFEGVVAEGRLELREDQVQCMGKKGIEEENQVLSALSLIGAVIFGPASGGNGGKSRCELNYKSGRSGN